MGCSTTSSSRERRGVSRSRKRYAAVPSTDVSKRLTHISEISLTYRRSLATVVPCWSCCKNDRILGFACDMISCSLNVVQEVVEYFSVKVDDFMLTLTLCTRATQTACINATSRPAFPSFLVAPLRLHDSTTPPSSPVPSSPMPSPPLPSPPSPPLPSLSVPSPSLLYRPLPLPSPLLRPPPPPPPSSTLPYHPSLPPFPTPLPYHILLCPMPHPTLPYALPYPNLS